ncbi:MAG: hypothetical protein N4A47_06540 [Clostridia bacterium]|jgi:hypothetical protein|nr:hypothetical protein [Clostridia bacterium]
MKKIILIFLMIIGFALNVSAYTSFNEIFGKSGVIIGGYTSTSNFTRYNRVRIDASDKKGDQTVTRQVGITVPAGEAHLYRAQARVFGADRRFNVTSRGKLIDNKDAQEVSGLSLYKSSMSGSDEWHEEVGVWYIEGPFDGYVDVRLTTEQEFVSNGDWDEGEFVLDKYNYNVMNKGLYGKNPYHSNRGWYNIKEDEMNAIGATESYHGTRNVDVKIDVPSGEKYVFYTKVYYKVNSSMRYCMYEHIINGPYKKTIKIPMDKYSDTATFTLLDYWVYLPPDKSGVSYTEARYDKYTVVSNAKGSLVQSNIIAPAGAYPNNGKHSDGYWYVRIYNQNPNKPTITAPATGIKTKDNTVTVNWNFSDPDSGDTQGKYQLIGSTDNFTTNHYNSGVVTSSAKTKTTTALADGIWKFRVKVWDNNGGASSWGELTNVLVDTTLPDNPNLSTGTYTNTTDTSITMNWKAFADSSPSSGYHSVRIYAKRWNGSDWEDTVDIDNDGTPEAGKSYNETNKTSHVFNGLLPGNKYRFTIRYRDNAGNYGNYSWKDRWTVPSTPPTPTGSTAGVLWHKTEGRGKVILNWQAQTGATGYKVHIYDGSTYRAWDAGNTTTWDSSVWKVYPTEARINQDADDTRTIDIFNHSKTGLDLRDNPSRLYLKSSYAAHNNKKNYWFRVSAYNTVGESVYSTPYMPTLPNRTDADLPEDYTVNLTTTGTNSMRINVGATNDLLSGLPVNRYSYYNGSSWSTYESSDVKDIAGLNPNTQYILKTRVIDNVGNIREKNLNAKYTFAKEPSITVADASSGDLSNKEGVIHKITINAEGNPANTEYRIERATNDTFNENLEVIRDWSTSLTEDVVVPSKYTTYYYRVNARNGDLVETAYSDYKHMSGVPNITGSYGPLNWSREGRGYIKLTWPAVEGANEYEVLIYDGNKYRIFNVGNNLVFDSRLEHVYPTEAVISGYADNTRNDDIFKHDKSGLDLSDDPRSLYRSSTGTAYNSNKSYAIRVRAKQGTIRTYSYANLYYISLPDRTDVDAPIISVTGNPASYVNTDVTLSVTTTETESGLNTVLWQEGNKVVGDFVNGTVGNALSGGNIIVGENKDITIYARDNVGNERVEVVSVTKIDKVLPVIKTSGNNIKLAPNSYVHEKIKVEDTTRVQNIKVKLLFGGLDTGAISISTGSGVTEVDTGKILMAASINSNFVVGNTVVMRIEATDEGNNTSTKDINIEISNSY